MSAEEQAPPRRKVGRPWGTTRESSLSAIVPQVRVHPDQLEALRALPGANLAEKLRRLLDAVKAGKLRK